MTGRGRLRRLAAGHGWGDRASGRMSGKGPPDPLSRSRRRTLPTAGSTGYRIPHTASRTPHHATPQQRTTRGGIDDPLTLRAVLRRPFERALPRSRRIENWVDGAAQDSLYREMAAIFRRAQPMTFVLPEIRFAVALERIRGLARADAEAAAVLAQAQLRRVGVAVDIQTKEYFSWENRLARGATDVVLGAMNPDLGTIGQGLLDTVRTGYHDPGLEKLVVALDTAYGPASEDEIYAASWEVFRRDAPVTLIRPLVGRRVVHERAWELWKRQRQVLSGS